MNRYTIALALTLLAAPAMAQTPSVPELQGQLQGALDRLAAARASRDVTAARLDDETALVNELWQQHQTLTTQLSTATKARDQALKEAVDLRNALRQSEKKAKVPVLPPTKR